MSQDGGATEKWLNIMDPKQLKGRLISAALFSMAFEMLKQSVIGRVKSLYIDGFDENGETVSKEYTNDVLSLSKSPFHASIAFLRNNTVLDEHDVEVINDVKMCRNTLIHEMLEFSHSGTDFDINDKFELLVLTLKKIELWWVRDIEMSINSDLSSLADDSDEITTGTLITIQLLVNVSLGSEEDATRLFQEYKCRFG